jgi:hypothetical protein
MSTNLGADSTVCLWCSRSFGQCTGCLATPFSDSVKLIRSLKGEFHNCVDECTGQEFRSCIDNAELKASRGMELWSLKAYYSREAWFLGLIVVAVPLLAYVVGLWVGRGFRANPGRQ